MESKDFFKTLSFVQLFELKHVIDNLYENKLLEQIPHVRQELEKKTDFEILKLIEKYTTQQCNVSCNEDWEKLQVKIDVAKDVLSKRDQKTEAHKLLIETKNIVDYVRIMYQSEGFYFSIRFLNAINNIDKSNPIYSIFVKDLKHKDLLSLKNFGKTCLSEFIECRGF